MSFCLSKLRIKLQSIIIKLTIQTELNLKFKRQCLTATELWRVLLILFYASQSLKKSFFDQALVMLQYQVE